MQMEAVTAAKGASEELTKLQSMKERFCTEKGLVGTKVDPIFHNNRFGVLSTNAEATNLMQRLTLLADAAEAEANATGNGSSGSEAIDKAVGDEMDLDLADDLAEDLEAQRAEALKADPDAQFDTSAALKAAMPSVSANRAAGKQGGVVQHLKK